MQAVFLVCATLAVSVIAQTQTNKDKLLQRGIDFGITFFTKAEMAKMATCMEDPFYNQLSMDKMKDKGMSCGVSNCPMLKYAKAMDLLGQMDKCLKPANITTMQLAEKIYPDAAEIGAPLFNKAMSVIAKSKAAKKAKAQVINDGYGGLLEMATRPLIESVCEKMLKKVDKLTIKCAITIGSKVVNINGWQCIVGKV